MKLWAKISIILLAAAMLSGGLSACKPPEQEQSSFDTTRRIPLGEGDGTVEYKKITPREAQEKMTGDAVILDVRTQDEFDAGHIEGAILLPDYEIKDNAESVLPGKDETILVYCRSGNRSRTASETLIEMGYTQVYDFGGIIDWTGEIVK